MTPVNELLRARRWTLLERLTHAHKLANVALEALYDIEDPEAEPSFFKQAHLDATEAIVSAVEAALEAVEAEGPTNTTESRPGHTSIQEDAEAMKSSFVKDPSSTMAIESATRLIAKLSLEIGVLRQEFL